MSGWNSIYYDLYAWFLKAMVDVFFREIQTRGLHKTPETGPLFFVAAPHCNQFFDPLVLNRHCHRRISYLCAKKSYDKVIVGSLARGIRSIPVARAQDYAFRGLGKLCVLDRHKESTRVFGVGTKFLTQVKPGSVLALSKGEVLSEVDKVVSDSEVILKKEPADLASLDKLSHGNGLSYKVIPYFDQSNVYKEVHSTLDLGDCVGIFPEGGSHDRTELLPLKAGIAVMALGAMAANPNLNLKIVPCGMNYFHPDRFRSRAVIEYGTPFSVPKDMTELYKLGGEHKRKACGQLLAMISDSLKAVTVTAPDYETLMVIQAARRLYQAPYHKTKFSQAIRFNRYLVAGYLHYKQEPRVVQLKERILCYNDRLQQLGIRDHQVKTTEITRREAVVKLLARLSITAVYGILSLPAALLNSPIIAAAEIISKRKQAEALANSTVKVAARDVISSWKLVISLGVGPALYFFYAVCLAVFLYNKHIPIYLKWLAPFLALILIPVFSYYCLIFSDRFCDAYRSIRPLFLILVGNTSVKELALVREELSLEITSLIRELGPELFPEFDLDSQNNSPISNPSPTLPPLTPSSLSTLNWMMSPIDYVGEKLFDFSTPSSTSNSRRESRNPSRNASTNDLINLIPFSKMESHIPMNVEDFFRSDSFKPTSPSSQVLVSQSKKEV